ncbi:hypothetical protein GWK47_018754 [Chionoecetes opilio]|uniref:Uncharacterized protein n=1 Tax=Chionoecetes opilio TaxID=41210 RepID=A0A8J4XQW0_CHIOP|nr:hypothetical protein GWK47_018754 [Chionoecetes opilio]
MDLTRKNMGTAPRYHFRDWRPPKLAVPNLGSGRERAGRQRWSGPWSRGSRDQVVGCPSKPTAPTRPQKGGPCPTNKKWGKTLLCLSSPYPEWGTCGVLVFLGFSSRRFALQTFPNLMGELDQRIFGTGIMGGKVATVLEAQGEALRWTFKPSRREAFRMIPGIGKTCHFFPRWCPPGGNFDSLLLENAPPMDVKSPSTLKDLDVRGHFRLTKKEERGLQRLCPSSSELRKGLG